MTTAAGAGELIAVVVPVAVLAVVAATDWISAVIIAATLPLIPLFAVLVGAHTRARTRRQRRLLALLAGHFPDVVEGLPTLKVFGRARAQEQVIGKVTDAYRPATMSALRVAFLSAAALSAGQRQQIALARAFLRDAPLLLLDEPAAHLDPASAARLAETLRARPGGRTVIVITHGAGWAAGPGRTVRLDHGRLLPPATAAVMR